MIRRSGRELLGWIMNLHQAMMLRARGATLRTYRPDGTWVETRIRNNGVGFPTRQWRSTEQPVWRFCLYVECWDKSSRWEEVTGTDPL